MMMADLCKLADSYISNQARFAISVSSHSRTKIVSAYYSQPLKDLIRRCRAKVGKDRPDAHALYAATKEKMEYYRVKAYTAEEESRSERYPGYLFQEKVLFSMADQDLFRENSDFRGHFLEANLGPVWKAEEKYDMKEWDRENPENDENDISIETDHHSSSDGRRTAPEARVRADLASRFITTECWNLFVQNTFNPAIDLPATSSDYN